MVAAKKSDMGAPFGLAIAGGIITLIISIIGGLYSVMMISAVGALASAFGAEGVTTAAIGVAVAMLVWGIVASALVIVGAMMMRKPSKARTGAILVLVFGILCFFTPWAGLIIGPILAIIGGALGITKTK